MDSWRERHKQIHLIVCDRMTLGFSCANVIDNGSAYVIQLCIDSEPEPKKICDAATKHRNMQIV